MEENNQKNSMAPPISSTGEECSSADAYFHSLPCGYRFCPTDNELVEHYLMRKVLNQPLPLNRIHDVYIYDYHPKDLTAKYNLIRESGWFFFTSTERKYPRGGRPSRTAKDLGHWKATGKKDVIRDALDNEIGSKRTLEFLDGGTGGKSKKTDWKMHEYKLEKGIAPPNKIGHGTKLDNCVLVKIYQSSNAKDNEDNKGNVESTLESDQQPSPLNMDESSNNTPSPTLKRRRGMRTSTTSKTPVGNPSYYGGQSSQNGTFVYHPGPINNFNNHNYTVYNMETTPFTSQFPLPDSVGMGTGLFLESVNQIPLVDSSSFQLPAHVRDYEISSLEMGPGNEDHGQETLEELKYTD